MIVDSTFSCEDCWGSNERWSFVELIFLIILVSELGLDLISVCPFFWFHCFLLEVHSLLLIGPMISGVSGSGWCWFLSLISSLSLLKYRSLYDSDLPMIYRTCPSSIFICISFLEDSGTEYLRFLSFNSDLMSLFRIYYTNREFFTTFLLFLSFLVEFSSTWVCICVGIGLQAFLFSFEFEI